MLRLFLVAVVAFPLAACNKKDDTPAVAAIRSTVAAELPGITFGVAGQVVRGDRRAVIVWPAFDDGEPVGDDIVAFVLSEGGDGWSVVERNVALSQGSEKDALARALGGSDGHTVVRECGVAASDLAEHLARNTKAFAEARVRNDADAAVQAYEQMTHGFAWNHVAQSDMVPELLLLEAPRSWYCGAKGCTLEIEHDGRRRAQTFALGECDGKAVVGEPLGPQP